MKKTLSLAACLFAVATLATTGMASEKKGHKEEKGEKLFKTHCASCHADGGNIINPAKPLKKASLEANGVKSWKDIVAKMRKPGPGMNTFSKKDVSDKDAKAIAEYVMKEFK